MIERPDSHREPASADKPMPELLEENSGAPEASVSNAHADVQRDGDQVLPTKEDVDAQASSQPSPQPDAEIEPKKSKDNSQGKTDRKSAQKTKSRSKKAGSKSKPKAQQSKRAKNNGTDKRAEAEAGAAGETGNTTAANDGEPMMAYVRGTHIEPAALPPTGTLPPQLEPLFPGMLSVAAVLATTAAAAGQGVQINTDRHVKSGSLALRVAIIGEERQLPQAVTPVLQAAYALEQQAVLRWQADKLKADVMGVADSARRRAYQQMLANAAMLGFAPLADGHDLVSPTQSAALPRPQFVLRNPGRKDVMRALAVTETGILLVDERRMPTVAGFGINYEKQTAAVLNAAAAGHLLELPDPRQVNCVRMRPVTAAVIGTLSIVDICTMHKADRAMLAATVFVPAAADTTLHPGGNAATTLAEVLGRVRELTAAEHNAALPLRLSAAARKVEEQAKTRFALAAAEVLPPLADYYTGVADLVRRVAIVLHLLDHAVDQADRLPAEVGKDVVLRASSFIEQCVLPVARQALAATSVAPEVRDGRRLLSYAQQNCSAQKPLKQQDAARILQQSMPAAAVHRAVARLVADGLLTPSNSDAAGRGNVFDVSDVVFQGENQLPDLVTDPRRPRQ